MTLRVLHVLDVLRPSGAETCLRVAGPVWTEEGVSCDVLATGDAIGSYAAPLRAAGYRTGHLPLRPVSRFATAFPRLVRRGRYDVVHTHVEGANAAIDLLALAGGAAVVQHVHNVFDFTGAARLERRVQRRLLRGLGVVFLGVSQDVVDHEATWFGNDARLFLNWADLDTFVPPTADQRAAARQALGVDAGQVAIASVGNCHDFKNHLAVVEAMAQLPSHVRWLHVGEGVRTGDERARAEQLGVGGRVRFLGQRDPLEVLHAADAFVMPSHVEGQGIAAIEALATGLPAVLADVPGLRNLRAMGVPAIWVGVDAASVAEGVRRLVDGGPLPGDTSQLEAAFGHRHRVPALAAVYREVA
jgi:glycosyltransferase involved in cell wall biosynthesis